MNIFRTLLDIIRANPLTTVLVVMLLVAAPGVLGVFAIFLLIPLVLILIGWISIVYRARKVQKTMRDQMRDAQNGGGYSGGTRTAKPEGKVTVHIPPQENKVSDDVGEYVSFKEVDE